MSVSLTKHLKARVRQRGLREDDVLVVMRLGEEWGDGIIMITERVARREIEVRRREIARIQRLACKAVVARDNHVITAYHETESKRRTRRRALNR